MKPGLYPKATMAEYLAIKAFSSGLGQRILSQSPLHAWVESPWNPDRERSDSGTADIGTFAHAMLLEGGTDALVICPFDDWRKNDAKAMRDDARTAGKLPILQAKVPEVEAMVEAAEAFIAGSELDGLLTDGQAEQTIVFEASGVLCKIRPDWLSSDHGVCLSYKTTAGSAQPDAWIRTQLPGYDLAVVLYEQGVRDAFPGTDPTLVHLVQEQSFPFACSLVALSPAWYAMAESKLALALGTWKGCLGAGKWHSYTSRICYAEPPAYLMAKAEEQELEGAIADPSILFEKP
jgi:exodeoxyribonuclease VIII